MNPDQGSRFPDDLADAAGGDAVTREGRQSGVHVVGSYGDEKSAGGLRIEEKVLIFSGDARFEKGAVADEGAIIF